MNVPSQPQGSLPDLGMLEMRVLALVAERRPNRLIRDRLRISETQLTHTLGRLYRASGIHRPGEPYRPTECRQRLEVWAREYFERLTAE